MKMSNRKAFRRGFRRFAKNPLQLGSLIVFVFVVVVVMMPQVFAAYDPLKMDYTALMKGPSVHHWFGTDQFGRDILSRTAYGAQNTMRIAVLSIMMATGIGTVLGVISGYFGKWVDQIIMRVVDSFFAFPSIILALFIIAMFGASMTNLIIAIGVVYVPIFARTIRGSTIALRESLFVKASRALGKSHLKIMITDILPNISSIVIVTFTTNLSTALLTEAGLGFLGLGVPPPHPTLGSMVGQGNNYLLSAPWMALFPGLVIAVVVLSINIIGDGLRDVLDPRVGK